jgi:hypothetical protein
MSRTDLHEHRAFEPGRHRQERTRSQQQRTRSNQPSHG